MADVFEGDARRILNPADVRVIVDDDMGGPAYIVGQDLATPFQVFTLPDGSDVVRTNANRGSVANLYGTAAAPIAIDRRALAAVREGIIEAKFTLEWSAVVGGGPVRVSLVTYSDAAGTQQLQSHEVTIRPSDSDSSGTVDSRLVLDEQVVSFRVLAFTGDALASSGDTITMKVSGFGLLPAPEGLPAPRYIPATQDLNGLVEPGIYVRLSSTWRGMNNPMNSGGFILFVSATEGQHGRFNGHIQQLIYSFRQNQIYFVRETLSGDGSAPDIPASITTDWQERDNYAAQRKGDATQDLEVSALENSAAVITREDQSISFSTRGTGPNEFFVLDRPQLPVISAQWRPGNFGVIGERNQFQIVLRTARLHGLTPMRILIGQPGATAGFAVQQQANAAAGTTTITATVPNLLSLEDAAVVWNLQFTDATFLYGSSIEASKTPVTIDKAVGKAWLEVPDQATQAELDARSGSGYVTPALLSGFSGGGGDGTPGAQGPQGERGPQGPQGETGPAGPQGPQGEAGQRGPEGQRGPAGADGAQGPQGEQGIQGQMGAMGTPGADGAMGAMGAQGPQGPAGPQGERGLTGPQGPRGDVGEGATAAVTEVDMNFSVIPATTPSNVAAGATLPFGAWTDVIPAQTGLVGSFIVDAELSGLLRGIPLGGPTRVYIQWRISRIRNGVTTILHFGDEFVRAIYGGNLKFYDNETFVIRDILATDMVTLEARAGSSIATSNAGGQAGVVLNTDTDGISSVAFVPQIVGSTGPTGPAGEQGPAGADGQRGPAGPTGPAGPRGNPGADGAAGAQGPAGADGQRGATGPAGPMGDPGVDGAAGQRGPQGLRGPAGQDGQDGQDGAAGARGPAGPAGPAGQDGAPGADGAQGPRGDRGEQGPRGDRGPAGPQGEQGPAGPQGPAGTPGSGGGETTDATLEVSRGVFTFSQKSMNERDSLSAADSSATTRRHLGATTVPDLLESTTEPASFAAVESYNRMDAGTGTTQRSGSRITFSEAGILSSSGAVRVWAVQNSAVEDARIGIKMHVSIRSGTTNRFKYSAAQLMDGSTTLNTTGEGEKSVGTQEFMAPITLANEVIASGDKLEIWFELLARNTRNILATIAPQQTANRNTRARENQLELRFLTVSGGGGGDAADVSGKADTDLQNIDTDLTEAEKAAILERIGAQRQIPIEPEKAYINVSSFDFATFAAALAGDALTDPDRVELSVVSDTTFNSAATPVASMRVGSGLQGRFRMYIASAAGGLLANNLASGVFRTNTNGVLSNPVAVTRVGTGSFNGESLTLWKTAVPAANWPATVWVRYTETQNPGATVLEHVSPLSSTNQLVFMRADGTSITVDLSSLAGGGGGGAGLPTPPADGRDFYLAEGQSATGNVPVWREDEYIINKLVVQSLPPASSLEFGAARYLDGPGTDPNTGPGINIVDRNPDFPTNQVRFTVGTDAGQATERGVSIDSVVGTYGSFTKNPNNAVSHVTAFTTAPSFNMGIRDDLVRTAETAAAEVNKVITVAQSTGSVQDYGWLAGSYGAIDSRTVGSHTLNHVVAHYGTGSWRLEVAFATATVAQNDYDSIIIQGRRYDFRDAVRGTTTNSTFFFWEGGREIAQVNGERINITFLPAGTEGALRSAITIRAGGDADFSYGLSRQSAGDRMVNGVQYRQSGILSTQEGGPGIPLVDANMFVNGRNISLALFSDTQGRVPIMLADEKVWRHSGALDVQPRTYETLPGITTVGVGTLAVRDGNLFLAESSRTVASANRNRVILNLAGHEYGLLGGSYARNHVAAGNIVDDPTYFIGEVRWYQGVGQTTQGTLELNLRDDDPDNPLPDTLIVRAQLFGRSAVETFTLSRTLRGQLFRVPPPDGPLPYVTYRRYEVVTPFYVDDRDFSGFSRTEFRFFTAFTSDSNNTPFNITGDIHLPSEWARVSAGNMTLEVAEFDLGTFSRNVGFANGGPRTTDNSIITVASGGAQSWATVQARSGGGNQIAISESGEYSVEYRDRLHNNSGTERLGSDSTLELRDAAGNLKRRIVQSSRYLRDGAGDSGRAGEIGNTHEIAQGSALVSIAAGDLITLTMGTSGVGRHEREGTGNGITIKQVIRT